MNFLIADIFTNSLAKLTGDEQKAVKTAAFDLQPFTDTNFATGRSFWVIRISRPSKTSFKRICSLATTSSILTWVM